MPDRYARQLRLPGFGPEQQRRLGGARIAVIGAGALGSPALEYLTAAGAGRAELVVLLRRRRCRRPAADGRRRLRQRDPLPGAASRREWRRHLHLLCAELLRWASTACPAASSPVLLLLHANSTCSRTRALVHVARCYHGGMEVVRRSVHEG